MKATNILSPHEQQQFDCSGRWQSRGLKFYNRRKRTGDWGVGSLWPPLLSNFPTQMVIQAGRACQSDLINHRPSPGEPAVCLGSGGLLICSTSNKGTTFKKLYTSFGCFYWDAGQLLNPCHCCLKIFEGEGNSEQGVHLRAWAVNHP